MYEARKYSLYLKTFKVFNTVSVTNREKDYETGAWTSGYGRRLIFKRS